MIAGYFFDPEHEDVSSYYGYFVEQMIFRADVLQTAGEAIVLRGGDIIVSAPAGGRYEQFLSLFGGPLVDGRSDFGEIRTELAFQTALNSMVFAIVLHGISSRTAWLLGNALVPSLAFLGWKELDFDFEPHRYLLGEKLLDRYWLQNRRIRVPGISLPHHEIDKLTDWGFDDVGLTRSDLLGLLYVSG